VRNPSLLSAVAGLLMLSAQSLCAATLVPVPPVPDSVETDALGINDNNVVIGAYVTSDGLEHAFFGTLDGNYTTFDAGDNGTEARGINDDGVITGFFNSSAGNLCKFVPFERDPGGTIVNVTKDGRLLKGQVQQINKAGTFVGNSCDSAGNYLGYYGADGIYQGDIGGFSHSIAPRGINKRNVYAGWFIPDGAANMLGFILQPGILSIVSYPDPSAVDTVLTSINDKRIATGNWDDGTSSLPNGFVLNLPKGTFAPVNVPGARYAQAFGINNAGLFAVVTDIGSFIYCPRQKNCPATGFRVPDNRPIRVSPDSFRGYRAILSWRTRQRLCSRCRRPAPSLRPRPIAP
jgi:hypothetical protein